MRYLFLTILVFAFSCSSQKNVYLNLKQQDNNTIQNIVLYKDSTFTFDWNHTEMTLAGGHGSGIWKIQNDELILNSDRNNLIDTIEYRTKDLCRQLESYDSGHFKYVSETVHSILKEIECNDIMEIRFVNQQNFEIGTFSQIKINDRSDLTSIEIYQRKKDSIHEVIAFLKNQHIDSIVFRMPMWLNELKIPIKVPDNENSITIKGNWIENREPIIINEKWKISNKKITGNLKFGDFIID